MRKYEYSNELVNAVKKFLKEDDWKYSFDENIGVFDFGLRIKSKLQKIRYLIDTQEDAIIIYGVCPIGVDCNDPEMMARMAEFFCRANYGLKNGCFEFDFRDGEVRFKSYIDCDEHIPSTKVIGNSIYCTARMFKRYAPGITDIIFAGRSAEEAVEECEKQSETELRSMVRELFGESDDGANVDEMLARLSERFGASDEEEGSSVNAEAAEEEEIRIDLFADKKGGGE